LLLRHRPKNDLRLAYESWAELGTQPATRVAHVGFGAESIPAELDTAADLQKVGEALGDAGFSQTDIDNILGCNWVRLLMRVLP